MDNDTRNFRVENQNRKLKSTEKQKILVPTIGVKFFGYFDQARWLRCAEQIFVLIRES